MKCVKCARREATTEVLRRHNNHVEKLYLCDECAKEYESDTVMKGLDMLDSFFGGSPMGLFGNFAGFFDGGDYVKTAEISNRLKKLCGDGEGY